MTSEEVAYPVATIKEQAIVVKIPDPKNPGQMLKHEQQAMETIRTGQCPYVQCEKRGKRSMDFRGINEWGWVFWCSGRHYFLNQPPVDSRGA